MRNPTAPSLHAGSSPDPIARPAWTSVGAVPHGEAVASLSELVARHAVLLAQRPAKCLRVRERLLLARLAGVLERLATGRALQHQAAEVLTARLLIRDLDVGILGAAATLRCRLRLRLRLCLCRRFALALRLRVRLLAEGVHDGSSGFGDRRRWGFLGSRQRRRRGHLLLIWDDDLTVVIIRCGFGDRVLESRLWCDGGFGGSLWLRLRLRRQQGEGETCFSPAEKRRSNRCLAELPEKS